MYGSHTVLTRLLLYDFLADACLLRADYKYTGDGALLLKHLDKIEGIAWLLRQRRTAALAAYPESDSRHGMPTGILPPEAVPLTMYYQPVRLRKCRGEQAMMKPTYFGALFREIQIPRCRSSLSVRC